MPTLKCIKELSAEKINHFPAEKEFEASVYFFMKITAERELYFLYQATHRCEICFQYPELYNKSFHSSNSNSKSNNFLG